MGLVDRVRTTLAQALDGLAGEGAFGAPAAARVELAAATGWTVERPKRAEHGDLATNVALVLTKRVGKPPRVIAELLVQALANDDVVVGAEIAGPGFVNLRLHPRVFHGELRAILAAGSGYGRVASATRERINLEFVSANPTGPLLVSHGRGAIFGDAVARLLEATGNRVTREYYVNDFGNQVRLFAASVKALAEGNAVPEEGYKGAYVATLATHLKTVDPAALQADEGTLARTCVTWMLRGIPGSHDLPGIKTTLRRLGVEFDVWFSEESLHRWGNVAVALRQLDAGGHLVRKDGALFFQAKDAGTDDKDRVVQKSDGAYTYFASDIAYFADKIARGYDRLMITLGADHHGYVARVRNSLAALGLAADRFDALLYQLVFLYRGGELVKMGKRAGNIITIEEVAEEIDEAAGFEGAGRDALRYFFLSRSANSNVEFDIDLAKKKSDDNPVFYVQYGYARLSSILKKAGELGLHVPTSLTDAQWAPLALPDELALAHRVSDFEGVLAEAAAAREPHKIVFYVNELANSFQSYFTRRKTDPILPQDAVRAVPGWEAKWDFEKTAARLAWVAAIRTVYAAALGLLGVSAPERMDRPEGADAETEEPEAKS
ncbi:MAG TPA: arginine--tRNA ligase [Polyangiaceae bacterium]|jgi:arginyl-tRNA synthetase